MNKIKVTPDIYFFICLGGIFLLHYLFPTLIIPSYNWLGIIFISAGILVVYLTNYILIRKKTSIKPFESPSLLVTSEPFRWSRNPIYLGMTLILLGASIYAGSLSSFIPVILFATIIDRLFIAPEERELKRLFGDEYLIYQKKVRRWI